MHDNCQKADTDVPSRRLVAAEKVRQSQGFRPGPTWHGCCKSLQERVCEENTSFAV